MITRPTSEQLVRAVRNELRETVKPCVEDPAVRETVGMMESLLGMVERRVEKEALWMREEIAEIEGAALDALNKGDPSGRIREALSDLRNLRGDGSDTDMSSLRREYSAAGEVLSRCIEMAIDVGGEQQEKMERMLQSRLDREVEIRGEFSLVGRD